MSAVTPERYAPVAPSKANPTNVAHRKGRNQERMAGTYGAGATLVVRRIAAAGGAGREFILSILRKFYATYNGNIVDNIYRCTDNILILASGAA